MAVPAQYDWTVWVKSSDPYTFTFLDGTERVDLSTTPVIMAVEWAGGTQDLVLKSGVDDEIVVLDQNDPLTKGQVSVDFTDIQRSSFPLFSKAKYQLGREIDGSYTLDMYGAITFQFWVNYPET